MVHKYKIQKRQESRNISFNFKKIDMNLKQIINIMNW